MSPQFLNNGEERRIKMSMNQSAQQRPGSFCLLRTKKLLKMTKWETKNYHSNKFVIFERWFMKQWTKPRLIVLASFIKRIKLPLVSTLYKNTIGDPSCVWHDGGSSKNWEVQPFKPDQWNSPVSR